MAPVSRMGVLCLAILLAPVLAGWAGDARQGEEVVARALDKMGGPDLLDRTEGLAFHASGWYDKVAERQGWSMETSSPGTFVERIAVDSLGETVGYEYREDRYDGTVEELREIYSGSDRRLIVVVPAAFAVDLRSPEHAAARRKVLRRVPALLLQEILARPSDLRTVGEGGGDTLRIAGTLSDGTRLRLHFTRSDSLLRRVSYEMDYLSFGDAELSWLYGGYRPVDGVGMVPHRYGVLAAGRRLTDMKVLRTVTGRAAVEPWVEVPEGIRIGEPQEVGPTEDASSGARVDTLGPGVYRVVNLRGGFHPLFVRMGDSLVAVDAPAGYPLPNELPAGDVAPGPASDWLSLRYLELMEEAVPGIPVSHMILTHFHNDHGGGLRAFVAEGATVVASAADTAEIRSYVEEPHTLAPDRLTREPRPLSMEVVEDRWVMERDGRRLEVLELGPNPHTQGMLVLHLPGEEIMFVSDLFDPTGNPLRFPKPEHAPLDIWLGSWLRQRGLTSDRIYTMHGSGLVGPEHLERLEGMEPPGADVEWLVRDEPVEAAGPDVPLVEPHLAVDPVDPEHLVLGAIVVDGDRDPWHCAALTSGDGGATWSRIDFPALDRCIDPWAVALPDGRALLSGIEIRRDADTPERFRLLAFGSDDGGWSWSVEPDTLGLGFDHPVLVPSKEGDIRLASRRNALGSDGRVRHRLSVGRVTQDGRELRFEETASLTPAVVGMTTTGLALLPDGSLVVSYWDYQREVDGFGREGMLDRARGWVVRSQDGGQSFGPPYLVGDHCASGGPEGAFPGYPSMVADSTGGSAGRLYHACVRPGLDGIAVSVSEDGGRRWSEPVRVDGGSPHARTPMMAVNRDGALAVAWYDRRLDPEEVCQDVYLAVSTDGARTFSYARRLTTETSCPDVPGNQGVSGSWPMGGDYGALAAGPDGTFHIAWADSRDGAFDLRRSRFRVVER